MKKSNLLLVVAVAALVLMAADPFSGTTNSISLDEARLQSQKTGKPVLIDFYTTWCPPCKQFDKAAKNDPQVQEMLEKVILVKVDSEKGDGVKLAKAYWVDRYPTYIMMRGDGNVQDQWTGYRKDYFLQKLNSVLEDIRNNEN